MKFWITSLQRELAGEHKKVEDSSAACAWLLPGSVECKSSFVSSARTSAQEATKRRPSRSTPELSRDLKWFHSKTVIEKHFPEKNYVCPLSNENLFSLNSDILGGVSLVALQLVI